MTGTYASATRQAEKEYGELLERGKRTNDLSEFSRWADDPVGFIRERLGEEPWSVQEEVALSVRDNRKTAVVGCNGLGKDWSASRIALWWGYAVGGVCIITAPTERQLHEVIMRKEVARAKRAGGLPGDLYTGALRIHGDEASIVAKTATAVSALTGFHDPRVLAVITEAQGVEPFAWEALMACTTGPEDRILAVGNPLTPSGRFYKVASSAAGR